jgi:septum formation protein
VPPPRLILASASPRRQELLREAGYAFIVSPADIDETDHPPGLPPGGVALYLARKKADAVADRFPDDVVLAADTVVSLHGQPLSKPSDAADARRMLAGLSGTTHAVLTGVALVHRSQGHSSSRLVSSDVHMRPLTPAEIDDYVAGGQWQGKAGGYGIQDEDPFVTRITGSLSNIVGLPMEDATVMLGEAGVRSENEDRG